MMFSVLTHKTNQEWLCDTIQLAVGKDARGDRAPLGLVASAYARMMTRPH